MGEESRKVEICLVGVGLVWTIGAVLLTWETLGGPSVAGKWALYLAGAAAAWTVIIALSRARRRVVAAMARELALAQREDDTSLRTVP